jgi:hypothetical protein
MTLADWISIINAVIVPIVLALIGIFVPRAIAAFEARTKIHVTDQERAAVMQAVGTAVGLLRTQLLQGKITVADITPNSHEVRFEAQAALTRVPTSAQGQDTTVNAAANMIAARVVAAGPILVEPAVREPHRDIVGITPSIPEMYPTTPMGIPPIKPYPTTL